MLQFGSCLLKRCLLLVTPALIINFVPATLTVPREEYELGWRASWILFEVMGVCWLVPFVARWLARPEEPGALLAAIRPRSADLLDRALSGSRRRLLSGGLVVASVLALAFGP